MAIAMVLVRTIGLGVRASRLPGCCLSRGDRVSLLADSPVDALAQEVRMAHVPRILLDHVHQRFAHRDAVLLARAVVEADGSAEVLLGGHELLGEGNLAPP